MKPTTLLTVIALLTGMASMAGFAGSSDMGVSQIASVSNPPATLTEEERGFLDRHWQTTIPLQGEVPKNYSNLESSLDPASCGLCHEQQYKDWQTTFHAHAMGPGILGQVIDMVGSDNAQAQICWSCHTPLAEQQDVLREGDDWQSNAAFDETLQHSGLVCAGCHVRQHVRFGPPRKDTPNVIGHIDDGYLPHNGFTATTAFSNSAFCANCHQFKDDGFALNGKLLENTYKEWQESRYAEAGIHCQTCHMPDRRHTWRGIHDPEMTKRAVTIEVNAPQQQYTPGELYEARITITNSGAGHYFPTYVTPKVFVRAELLDADNSVISNSLQEAIIGRETTADLSQELYDTRIAPDDHVSIVYREALHNKPTQLKVSIVVEPDHFYERFYKIRLANMAPGRSTDLLREALASAQSSHFTLFEQSYPINVDFSSVATVGLDTHSASSPETKAEVAINEHKLYWNDDDIHWHDYHQGRQLAKAQNKPILLIFYADWCPTCHAYRPIFEDKSLVALSEEFVMVRVNTDKHPEVNTAYIPEEEWEYVPRTFALFPDGSRMDNVYSKTKAPRYFLSADTPAEFLFTMQAALLNHQHRQSTR
ncbi:MAG: hypothetical protein COC05_00005 [Gammaproteobacteria bacterium]|nr:MAG: hypothetical protein COC05_00005 [Gammaproteobacteria bacterium]